MDAEMDARFRYHQPRTDARREAHESIRTLFANAAREVEAVVPQGRERSVTLTKIEEAMFWANAGVARQGDDVAD